MADLGRLTRVDLREAWESEAQDFTPLGIVIGLVLVLSSAGEAEGSSSDLLTPIVERAGVKFGQIDPHDGWRASVGVRGQVGGCPRRLRRPSRGGK